MTRTTITRRSGFAMLIALLVLALVALITGWSLSRLSVLGASVDTRIEGYVSHNESLSARDTAIVWIARAERDGLTLDDAADDSERDFAVRLSGTTIELFARDGQGRFLANLEAAATRDEEDRMLAVISRIPLDRPDLVRTVGPGTISVRAMDDALIEALAGDSAALAGALRALRADPDASQRDLARVFTDFDVPPALSGPVARSLTFQPILWEINARVSTDDGTTRYYQGFFDGSDLANPLRQWRRVTSDEFNRSIGLLTPAGQSTQQ